MRELVAENLHVSEGGLTLALGGRRSCRSRSLELGLVLAVAEVTGGDGGRGPEDAVGVSAGLMAEGSGGGEGLVSFQPVPR